MPDRNTSDSDETITPRLGHIRQRTPPGARAGGLASSPVLRPAGASPSRPSASPAGAAQETDYAVGYRKPPRHTQFKAGRSGNPKGRPKGAKGLNTITRELMTQKVRVRTASGETRMSRIESVYQKTHELAMKGSLPAIVELFRRYAAAVPDSALEEAATSSEDEMTAADLMILAALRARSEAEGDE